jgi:hypothetical protein
MKTFLIEYLTRKGEYKITYVKSDIVGNAYQTFMEHWPDDGHEVIGVKRIDKPGFHGQII